MSRSRSLAALICLVGLALGSGGAALAEGAKHQIERGSAIGTPLPVEKVEAAPIPPPPYSEAEKAALAKLDQTTSTLGSLRDRLARELDGLTTVMSWLICLAAVQLVVLGVQLLVLRRIRRPAAPPAGAAAPPAQPSAPSAKKA